METVFAIIVQLVAGAAGGAIAAGVIKIFDMGMTLNVVAGAVGGVLLTWLLTIMPGIGSFVGHPNGAGINFGILLAQVITASIGGGILTGIGGIIKNTFMKG